MSKKHGDKGSTRGKPKPVIREDGEAMDTTEQGDWHSGLKASGADPAFFPTTGRQDVHLQTHSRTRSGMQQQGHSNQNPDWKAQHQAVQNPPHASTRQVKQQQGRYDQHSGWKADHQGIQNPPHAGSKSRKQQQGHSDRYAGRTDNLLFNTSHQGFQESYYELTQDQKQQQLQRSIEASKQMLYGVFGNVITILEEFEKRELAKRKMSLKMPKSDIHIPEQGHKTFADIKSNVETQLLLFETQTKACPPEAIAEVLEELKRKTLSWSAVREEMGIKELHQTDTYITQLYEILAKGRTNHRPVEAQNVTEKVMREGFQAMLKGEHDRAELDRGFKTNPDQKAKTPKTRSSEQLHDGARRIARARGDQELDGYLEQDVKNLEQQGPDDLK